MASSSRATNATLTWGFLVFPLKAYNTAVASASDLKMSSPHSEGGAVLYEYRCADTGKELSRPECKDRRVEVAKGKWIVLTKDELDSIDEGEKGVLDVVEFCRADAIPDFRVESTRFLDPGKGADKAYALFRHALLNFKATAKAKPEEVVALCQWQRGGRSYLCVVRAWGESGLIAQDLYYDNEVRTYEPSASSGFAFAKAETDVAQKLLKASMGDGDLSKFSDRRQAAVDRLVQAKVDGGAVPVAEGAPVANAVDMVAALKASLEAVDKGKKPKAKRAPRKAKAKPKAKPKAK